MIAARLIAPLDALFALLPGLLLLGRVYGKRLELLTPFWMQAGDDGASFQAKPTMPKQPNSLSTSACMLVVGLLSEQRDALRERCAVVHPGLRLEFVNSFTDAVMRLARGGVDVVLLDLRQLANLSPAAPLVLRGIAPDARLLSLGSPNARPPGGIENLADESALSAWLARQRG